MQSYLRMTEICRRTGLSRWTIWRMEKEGSFPKSVKLGKNAVGWLLSELDTWEQHRQAAREVVQ
jgi:prophage regulatory protein